MTINKKILIWIGSLTAFVAVVFAIAYFASGGLTSVIYKQLSAIRAGEIIKAYAYTSIDFRGATSLNDFEEFVSHYPALKNNKSAKFSETQRKNDTGIARGTLYADDGTATPVEYLLVKEDGEWKVLGIQINPGAGADVEDKKQSVVDTEPVTLKTYDNKDSRYTLDYPSNWEYEKAGDGTVIFSGKRGTPAYFSTVNVQTVLSKKNGGDFSSVKEFMADIKSQATSQSPSTKFIESGTLTVVEKNGKKDKGEFTIFTYNYKGKEFKQWQVVVLRNDGQVFYAWAYTSPVGQYENDVAVAKTMLESWVIY